MKTKGKKTSYFGHISNMPKEAPAASRGKNSKKKTNHWESEGEDQIYIYQKFLQNGKLRYQDFIHQHSDWLDRYNNNTLQNNFSNSKKRLDAFKRGDRK